MKRRNPRGAIAAAGALSVISAVLLGGCATTAQTVDINTLWYSKNGASSGVTPVSIASTDSGDVGDFNVDLKGFKDANTDDQWNSSAWTGATLAALITGIDPRGTNLSFDVSEQIGGPSAGGLMTAGSIAALVGSPVRSDVAATGTVLPDGSIGEVAGIPNKLRGAKEAGIATVAYPSVEPRCKDEASGESVDVAAYGKSLGLSMVPIKNVNELVALLADDPPTQTQADPGEFDDGLLKTLAQATQASLKRMTSPSFVVLSPPSGGGTREQQLRLSVAAVQTTVRQLISSGKPFEAFSTATLTERSVLVWNRGVEVEQAARTGIGTATKALLAAAQQQRNETLAARERAAQTKVSYVEQLVGLPDALSWSTDALATIDATIDVIGSRAQTPAELAVQASDLEQVQYDVERYLPVSISAVTQVGRRSLTNQNDAASVVRSYAKLMANAADANLSYYQARQRNLGADSDLPDARLAELLGDQWSEASANDMTQLSELVSATSVALSYYVSTTSLVAGAGVVDGLAGADVRAADRVAIGSRERFESQATSAAQTGASQARVLAAAGLDPSYVRWGSRWGTSVALGKPTAVNTDQTQREGLVYLWYASTTGRMLSATAATQGS